MRLATILKFLLPVWCAATPALAADPWMRSFPIRMGSHVLTARGPSGHARLLLDGKVIAGQRAGTLGFLLDWRGNVGTVPTVAIYDNQGGASCESGAEVLIALPPDGPPVTGRAPTLGCTQRPRVAADPTALVVVVQADQTQTGDVSLFDPEHGLRRVMVLDQAGGG